MHRISFAWLLAILFGSVWLMTVFAQENSPGTVPEPSENSTSAELGPPPTLLTVTLILTAIADLGDTYEVIELSVSAEGDLHLILRRHAQPVATNEGD